MALPEFMLRISAKTLGALAMPDCCPRCFWLRVKLKWPSSLFPSVFGLIDLATKKTTSVYCEMHGKLPPWFDAFGDLVSQLPVPHHSRFQIVDAASGVLLTGAPDEICQRRDGPAVIIDYKTSRHTDTQDSLMPIYRVQLNAYAHIYERLGMGSVATLGLIYFEPQIAPALLGQGFTMPFFAKTVPIDLDTAMIPPLLRKAQHVCDCERPPRPRRGCRDCERLDDVMELLHPRRNRVLRLISSGDFKAPFDPPPQLR